MRIALPRLQIREFVKDLLREIGTNSRPLFEACDAEIQKAQRALRGQKVGPRLREPRSLTMLLLTMSTGKPFCPDLDVTWVDDTAAALLLQAEDVDELQQRRRRAVKKGANHV